MASFTYEKLMETLKPLPNPKKLLVIRLATVLCRCMLADENEAGKAPAGDTSG